MCEKPCIWVLKNQLYKCKMGGMQVYKCLHEKAGRMNDCSVTWWQEVNEVSGCLGASRWRAIYVIAACSLPGGEFSVEN